MNVRLHIERLIVEGLDVPDRGALQAAVEGELTRLIGSEGIGAAVRTGTVPHLTAPAIDAGGTTEQLGGEIAGAIHRGFGGGRQ